MTRDSTQYKTNLDFMRFYGILFHRIPRGKMITCNLQLKDLEFLPATEMRETVKQCVLDGKPGGNFVLLPTATPLNVPLSKRTEENFEIMLETALEYGVY